MHQAGDKFSWEHAVVDSDLPPLTRHILLTMAVRMDKAGGSCFPTVEQLVDMTGLTKNTVRKYRDIAIEKGWLVMSDMGFRGQKWRRKQYVAAIPGTTICGVGNCEGGSSGDPPSSQKVGHVVTHVGQKGGSRGDPKVGHVVTQDKEHTNKQTNQRARARADAEGTGTDQHPDVGLASEGREEGSGTNAGASQVTPDPMADDRKALKALGKAHPQWPTYGADSRPSTEKAFLACQAAERSEGLALWRAYVGHVSGTLGRAKLCAMATYWREKRWQQLPDSVVERARTGMTEPPKGPPSARPFGPVWAAMRLAIASGAVVEAAAFKPTSFQQRLIERGQATLEGLAVDRAVQRFDSAAEQGRSPPVPDWAVTLKDAMEPVPVVSAALFAWREAFDARGWRWPPVPMDVVYLPKLGSEPSAAKIDAAIVRFSYALREAMRLADQPLTKSGASQRPTEIEPLDLP